MKDFYRRMIFLGIGIFVAIMNFIFRGSGSAFFAMFVGGLLVFLGQKVLREEWLEKQPNAWYKQPIINFGLALCFFGAMCFELSIISVLSNLIFSTSFIEYAIVFILIVTSVLFLVFVLLFLIYRFIDKKQTFKENKDSSNENVEPS